MSHNPQLEQWSVCSWRITAAAVERNVLSKSQEAWAEVEFFDLPGRNHYFCCCSSHSHPRPTQSTKSQRDRCTHTILSNAGTKISRACWSGGGWIAGTRRQIDALNEGLTFFYLLYYIFNSIGDYGFSIFRSYLKGWDTSISCVGHTSMACFHSGAWHLRLYFFSSFFHWVLSLTIAVTLSK